MLRTLDITDYAIVDKTTIEFEPGFNALTGETGAGKSILVEALALALGGRSSDGVIRNGKDRAVVEVLFDLDGAGRVKTWLLDNGFINDDDQLIMRRVISRTGRVKGVINGNLATMAQMREIGGALLDIHGQRESQTLFNQETHMAFLDSFLELDGLKTVYRRKFHEYESIRKKLDELKNNQKLIERKIDLLKFQTGEIEDADLAVGEDIKILAELKRLRNADRLMELTGSAIMALDEKENAAYTLAGAANTAVVKILELDGSVSPIAEALGAAVIHIEEAVYELRRYASTLENDPARVELLDNRHETIKNLKRKYGDSIEEILAFGATALKELETVQLDIAALDKLKTQTQTFGKQAADIAVELSEKRKKGAKKFSTAVEKHLADLNMGGARIEPDFRFDDHPNSPCVIDGRGVAMRPDGVDKMELKFSANQGESPKPLAKIASGGELSRLTLAIKLVISNAQPTPVMVFDEIDSGIGGATADRLGQKLRTVAQTCQVFCVTHLAQVARQAHTQYQIAKTQKNGRVSVIVKKLSRDERIKELARMAGGEQATEKAMLWAEEALKDI